MMVDGRTRNSAIMNKFCSNLLLKQLLLCLIFIISTTSYVSSDALKFHSSRGLKKFGNCAAKPERSTIKNVIINGQASGACLLKKGKSATVEIDFISKEQTKTVTAVVHGIIDEVHVPFPLPNSDGCKNCSLACPLKSGNTYSYKTAIPVKKLYPKVKLLVQWELIDEKKKQLVCIIVPCEIVS